MLKITCLPWFHSGGSYWRCKKISLWLVWPILRFFLFIAVPIWEIIKISLLLKMYFIKTPIFCAPLFYFKMIQSGIHPVHLSYICTHTGLSSFGCILRRGVRSPFQKWESGSSRLTSQPELEDQKRSLTLLLQIALIIWDDGFNIDQEDIRQQWGSSLYITPSFFFL